MLNTDKHPFDGLFSRTARVNWHQKGKTNLYFNKARDDGVAMASAGPYANNLHLASCQHLITQFFTVQMLFLTPNQQCLSTEAKPKH